MHTPNLRRIIAKIIWIVNMTISGHEFPSVPGSVVYFPVYRRKIPGSSTAGNFRQPVDSAPLFDSPRAAGRSRRANSRLFSRLTGISEHAEPEDAVVGVETGQHPLADQVAQGLRGAAAQGAVAGAAVEARDRVLVGKAVAAMHLDRLAGDPERHLVAGDLGDRGQQRVGERVGGGAGAVEDAARRLDVAVHLGDLPAHALEVGDGMAKGGALLGVFEIGRA